MVEEILPARPLIVVALSTVTGTRTGAATVGSTTIGSVGRAGSSSTGALVAGAVLVTAGVWAEASWGCGATHV